MRSRTVFSSPLFNRRLLAGTVALGGALILQLAAYSPAGAQNTDLPQLEAAPEEQELLNPDDNELSPEEEKEEIIRELEKIKPEPEPIDPSELSPAVIPDEPPSVLEKPEPPKTDPELPGPGTPDAAPSSAEIKENEEIPSASPAGSETAQPVSPAANAETGDNASQTPTSGVDAPQFSEEDIAKMVRDLVELEIFPEEALANPEQAVVRGQWANILVRTIGYKLDLISEFPFYRDVPLTHWAYPQIEKARQEGLIRIFRDGFYYPDENITYTSVYWGVANGLRHASLSESAVETLTAYFEDSELLSETLRPQVAKLINLRFFRGTRFAKDQRLYPESTVTYAGLAPFVRQLYLITHTAADIDDLVQLQREQQETEWLPAGMKLSLSPTSALFKERLGVGSSTYFDLVYEEAPLPRGSRFRGTVERVLSDGTLVFRLEQVTTPAGLDYLLDAELPVLFPPDETEIIAAGDVFETETEPPPAEASPAPLPGLPVESSGNTSETNSVPRSAE